MRRPIPLFAVGLIALVCTATPAHAQIWKRLKEKVTAKVDSAANAAADSTMDKAVRHATCVVTNTECIAAAEANGQPVVITDAQGNKVSTADSAQAMTNAAPKTAAAGSGTTAGDLPPQAFVNYDFVPGDSVLFFEDFTHDVVGDAPQRVIPTSGNVEVADYRGARWYRSNSAGGSLEIDLPVVLPQRFTFEADLASMDSWGPTIDFSNGASGHDEVVFQGAAGVGNFTSEPIPYDGWHVYHARVMADGPYVKVYVDGKRVANAPRVNIGRSNKILMTYGGNEASPFYITNIRVAEGGKPILWDALMAKGRVATHGILFATGSAHIRPESKPTLQLIADMLKAHADLKLTIEGHTDNTGAPAANETLSDQRAASVKTYLVSNFGIDGSRLDTKGYGDTKPVAPNTTAEGRQENRRVELVKR